MTGPLIKERISYGFSMDLRAFVSGPPSNDVTRSGRCSAGAEGIPCTGSPRRLRKRKRMTHRPDLEAGQGVKIRR